MTLPDLKKSILIAALTVGLAAPALANNNPSLFNKLKGSFSGSNTGQPYSFSKGRNGDSYPAFSETERKALQEQLNAEHRAQISARQQQVLAHYLSVANSGVGYQPARQKTSSSASSRNNNKTIYQLKNKNNETDKKPARLYNVPK